MGLSGVRLLPAMVVLCAPVSAAVGAHSLHYNLTVRCQGGSVLSKFFAQGCLDDQPFLSYDSERGSIVPWALWAETVLGPETWDTETQDLAESGENLRVTLADINFLKEEKGGSHSLQESWGCEIREDSRTRGFWNFYYDGEPFLSYHPETRSWTVQPSSSQILAMKVKNSWDADSIQSKAQWAHVQGTVCGRLRRYLNSWIAFNETTVSPTVNVTCDEVLEDTIFVTCWALGFYPQNISLTWLKDGEPLIQDTQKSGSILSYGNGTYQTWVSTRIPQGQEQRFSCHVGHSGNHITGTVSCGEPGSPRRGSQQALSPFPWWKQRQGVLLMETQSVAVWLGTIHEPLIKQKRTLFLEHTRRTTRALQEFPQSPIATTGFRRASQPPHSSCS
ncbi:MHC class I polypeptide-related sequence B-like isoform 2-T2 [Callospermophilus lateralis]|uniref:MHC class I polypeptide-related sequence B-like isoform X2 n=1 Tax=Callospermophilus lateralis TaxID=76772 RepID=UPI00403856C4